MTAKVIQGFFVGGQPKVAAPVLQPKAAPRPPGRPVPAFTGRFAGSASAVAWPPLPAFASRPPVAQARMPGPPLPAFAGRNPVAQARGAGDSFQVDPGRLGLVSGGGRPLPEAVRSQMETALGADFSAVRVHVGPQAERIGAVAFTVGNDLYFAPGRFQPDTIHGKQLLGHELAHVVQQRQGRVRNSMGTGVAVVRDTALEAEADRLGSRAAAYRVAVQPKLAQGAARPSAAVRVSPLRSAGPGGDTLIAGTRGRRVGSHTARPAHAADPANISHRLLAQRKAQDLVSSSRPFKQLSARQRNTKENAQIIQLHEKSCRFVVCTPKRVTTTTEVAYLLEGNDKYGEKHIEKHCPELTNVAKRRGWVGSIDDILRFAITQSTYTAYQVPDDRGSAICIPVTARKMMFLPIAEDGKIITAMIKDSETKAIKLFWSNGPDEIQDIGWKIVRGEDNRSMADAPWDLYTKSL